MTAAEQDEMYDNTDCPRCGVCKSFHCEDLRRRGASQHVKPHRERIKLYRLRRMSANLNCECRLSRASQENLKYERTYGYDS
jgi:hypothetical protein